MKKIVLLFLILVSCVSVRSQSFTISNNSNSIVYFQILAVVNGNCNGNFKTVTASVAPHSNLTYKTAAEINWSGVKPSQGFVYSGLKGTYIDASGACNSSASYIIGEAKCNYSKEATINTAKCGGTDELHLTWNSKDGNVSVSIN
jgi:hypothetical protein